MSPSQKEDLVFYLLFFCLLLPAPNSAVKKNPPSDPESHLRRSPSLWLLFSGSKARQCPGVIDRDGLGPEAQELGLGPLLTNLGSQKP